jgi:hypothetical protein
MKRFKNLRLEAASVNQSLVLATTAGLFFRLGDAYCELTSVNIATV